LSIARHAIEVTNLEEPKGIHRRKVLDHSGAAQVVERLGHLAVPVPEKSPELNVTVMCTPAPISTNSYHIVENLSAELLQRYFTELPEFLPTGYLLN
jgi:hypothetical protein